MDPAAFGADAMRGVERFEAEVGVDLRAQQANEASKIRRGLEGLSLERFRNFAEADLREAGKIDSDAARFGDWMVNISSLGTVSREQSRRDIIDRRAAELVADEARGAGLSAFKMPGHGALPLDQFASVFANMQPDEREGAMVEILKQINQRQAELIAAVKDQGKGGRNVPAPLPGLK